MTRRRHLVPVEPGIAVELVRAPKLLDEEEARAVHRQVAAELDVLADVGLIQRARQIARDFQQPSRHQDMPPAQWALLCQRMLGDVSDQVFAIDVIGGPRPARQARAAIERVLGLLLCLDDSLRGLDDDPTTTPEETA